MNYQQKLRNVQEFIHDNIDDVETLCNTFDIAMIDVANAFPDKLVKQYYTLFPPEIDDDEANNEYEEEAWNGFRTFDPQDE